MIFKNLLRERDDFQSLILEKLKEENGYLVRKADNYNSDFAMDIELLIKFIEDTQPETLEALKKFYKDKTEEVIIKHINDEIIKSKSSLLNVLKHGVYFDNGKN